MDGPTVTALAALLAAGVALANAYRQDRRAQFTQMITILTQLDARFEGPEFRAKRAAAAKWINEGSLSTDSTGEEAARDVLNFFETLAFLHRREAVDGDAVWHYFATWLLPYREALRPLIKREQAHDPGIYCEVGELADAIFQVEREKREWKDTGQVLSPANIQAMLFAEATLA